MVTVNYLKMDDPSKLNGDYETLKNKGNDSFKAKDYEKAITYYTSAIKEKDDEAIAYSNRAICYIYLKQYFHAIKDCDRALELDSSLTKAYYRRAIALKELSQFQKALIDFQKVFSLDPTFSLAQKEIESIQEMFKKDPRLELKLLDKPAPFRSEMPLKKIELRNQYYGARSYNQL